MRPGKQAGHNYAQVPSVNIPRSSFNRSSGLKSTMDADFIIPIFVDEIVPGDTFNMNATFFARLSTPLHPIMDNMYCETFWFFVPYRLLWDNWEKFHGQKDNPADTTEYTIPYLSSNTAFNMFGANAIFDYMGLPFVTSIDMTEVSALPFRAYNRIYNEWFRNQNLQTALAEEMHNGNDGTGTYTLQKRCKSADYFTRCLPWPQKGDAVSLPLLGQAPVTGIGKNNQNFTDSSIPVYESDGTNPTYATGKIVDGAGTNSWITIEEGDTGYPNIFADLEQVTEATINDLRLSFQLQRLLERDARSGTRYSEMVKAHFGVTMPDQTYRPEFLGGGSSRVNITPVANTSDTAGADQGDLAGFGTVSGTHGFTKSFVEHGVLMGLMNFRGDITYQQGLDRMWTRQTRYDHYMPVLSQIGEQAVLNKEIWYVNNSTKDEVFGYQERHGEYRTKLSKITGQFRSDYPASLHSWHLAEDFATAPALGNTFIQSNLGIPLERAVAVGAGAPHFIVDIHFDLKCARPMPLFGVPGNLDHF